MRARDRMKPLVWRRFHPGCYALKSDDRVYLYRWSDDRYDVEISGPPLWPIVDLAGMLRTSCGGVRLHFTSRAEAMQVTETYLRLFSRPPGRELRVISLLEFTVAHRQWTDNMELDPDDPECVIEWL